MPTFQEPVKTDRGRRRWDNSADKALASAGHVLVGATTEPDAPRMNAVDRRSIEADAERRVVDGAEGKEGEAETE